MTAFIVCWFLGSAFVLLGFYLGRQFERQEPKAPVYVLPRHVVARHPSSRPAHHERTTTRPTHLRVVSPIYDFEKDPA